jgi:hypothetical protein
MPFCHYLQPVDLPGDSRGLSRVHVLSGWLSWKLVSSVITPLKSLDEDCCSPGYWEVSIFGGTLKFVVSDGIAMVNLTDAA